ncbi:Ldh family oxidoreductase [Bradyrhizobium jicamae]|uniref:Ldh family oxidoreductase n=1 Tax=Bradyrhizobium jicamae TaxID=280332 RepID=UPI001BABF5D3|nr:Ldh family oxidoreductase [Bradyrhizobium jicamae]MBR0751572.1 Ldh family oxidoreductase [Bradyrhizobium jicamae]
MVGVGAGPLECFAAALLRAGGFSADQAEQTAAILVWANLRGVDSHGVLRIPRYLEMVELGLINPAAGPRQVLGKGAVAVIDAQRAPGAVAMNLATQTAVRLSDAHGIGWCAVRAITHAGAIGYYVQQAARAGRVAIAMTASKPLMVYHGSKTEGVSTNPIAIAAPTTDPDRPLLLDMSTASVAIGKIMAAKDAGQAIPAGWGVDEQGRETTDPHKVKAVLPMAGPKGSGLSLMIEVLASVMVANPLISVALTEGGDPGGNGLVVVVDPSAFGNEFTFEVDRLRAAIKGLPLADGLDAIYLPGERGFEVMEKRSRDGIPLAQGTRSRLAALARTLNVVTPEGLA